MLRVGHLRGSGKGPISSYLVVSLCKLQPGWTITGWDIGPSPIENPPPLVPRNTGSSPI